MGMKKRPPPAKLKALRVLPGRRGRGWLVAGPFRIPCALGPAGVVRIKREGDGGTPAGRFALLWGYFRPDRPRPQAGGVPLRPMRADTAWCENPESRNYNRPVPVGEDATDRMWREDGLYDLTFVLDQNFRARARNRGSAIFFHIARENLGPTAGCVAIPAAAMRRLAPHLARGATMVVP
jgi:L,D-peptidoglycan transpeptidase YkuD (ErfK/YbiS/YcfS/YnhG family)